MSVYGCGSTECATIAMIVVDIATTAYMSLSMYHADLSCGQVRARPWLYNEPAPCSVSPMVDGSTATTPMPS